MQVKTFEEEFGRKLTIKELVKGYSEDTVTGKVTSLDGKLNIRPPYQREFLYETEKQQAVIDTIMKGYPLNTMYWAKCSDGTFELMDGQQRTISICRFHDVRQIVPILDNGKVRNLTFDEFNSKQVDDFLNYTVLVYICEGDEIDKLNWFKTINIAGIKLSEQEMRNAIYTSLWVTDAKKYFSNIRGEGWASEGHESNGHTYGDYVNTDGGTHSEKETAVVRQKLLEIVLGWATDKYNREHNLSGGDKINIEDYMKIHKSDENALELWRYYEDVMEWVKSTFPTYRADMKKIEWGLLYNEFHENTVPDADKKVNKIYECADEISNIKNAYRAVLSGDLKLLNARAFDQRDKTRKFNEQKGVCPYCKEIFTEENMHGDHIRPWSKGGKTEYSNLQMLCTECNLKKSAYDVKYSPWDRSVYEAFDLAEWDS